MEGIQDDLQGLGVDIGIIDDPSDATASQVDEVYLAA